MPTPRSSWFAHVVSATGRRRRRAFGLVFVVAATLLALATVVVSPSAHGGAPAPRQAAPHGLASIPPAAQGPISAALGREQSGYRVVGLRARNQAQRFGAVFSHDGATVSSGAARVRFRLLSYGRGTAMRSAVRVPPRVSANRVDYPRMGVDEWYANGPLGLEQGFDVSARPGPASGPLTLALGLSGNVRPRLAGSDVLLDGAGDLLRYGGLSASDARGRPVRAWLQLRARRVLIRVDDRHAVYPLRIDPLVAQAKLTASDGAAGDFFAEVAVSPDTIAVGAGNHAVDGDKNTGAVYVFVKPASGWASVTQRAVLTASSGAGALGASVAISGDTIVAGASNTAVGANPSQGAVYVFVKPASGWTNATQTAELTASDGRSGDGLGESVAVAGDTVVAGPAQHDVDQKIRQGEAYAFIKPPTGWANSIESQRLSRADGAAGDFFGRSVAMSGDTVVVGAPDHKVGAADQGSAYVYTKTATGLVETSVLTAADAAAGDHLGFAVAASGDAVYVGAPEHQVGLNHQGAAYVFVKPFGGWNANTSQTAELTASDGATGDRFGSTLAASGDSVLAGAFLHQVGPNAGQGAAYLFTKPGDTWTSTRQSEELTASDGVTGDVFGISLGLSGNIAVVGAIPTIGANIRQGATYLFAVPPAIAIASPASGASYTQNSIIPASFSCTAPAGATITACAAPTQDGAPIDTSTLGQHTFAVSANDSDGITATRSATYTVIPSAAARPPQLSISALRQSASIWRLGGPLPQIARRRPPVGTTFSFVLSQRALARLSFTRASPGRTVRGKCVPQTVKNARRYRCTRATPAGTLTVNGHDGLNQVRFQGRLATTTTLRPGRYAMSITAITTAGQRASSRPLHFTITK